MSKTPGTRAGFKWRIIVSLTTAWMFLVMGITGLILFIAPQGRIAYWVDWHFLGLTKTDWGNIHIVACIFFLVGGGWHLYFNWKIFMNHLRDKIAKGLKMRKELFITTALTVFVVVSALFHIPPLGYLINLNDTIKSSWIESPDYEPPFGHAELLSLKRFCKKTNIDLKKATQALQQAKLKFSSPSETLEDIAKSNGISPKDVFAVIEDLQEIPFRKKNTQSKLTKDDVFDHFEGTGIGKMSVKAACEMAGDELSACLSRLGRAGVNVEMDDNMKQAADRASMRPIEVLQVMLVDSY